MPDEETEDRTRRDASAESARTKCRIIDFYFGHDGSTERSHALASQSDEHGLYALVRL